MPGLMDDAGALPHLERRSPLCLLDARPPNLYTDLRSSILRFTASATSREGSMDVLLLGAIALMFFAIVGMVVGCDKLGVHK